MSAMAVHASSTLGLPSQVRACLFDLDGVLAQTRSAHVAAWTGIFDAFLGKLAESTGTPCVPFDPVSDYRHYVDGKRRADGVRSFLASRGIRLPEGDPDDPGTAETVHGLGNRKNERLLTRLAREGVSAYDDAVEYVRAARAHGLTTAVVSASANCREVLAAA